MRDARFTSSPMTVYSECRCEPSVPAITLPVLMPIPMNSSGSPASICRTFRVTISICMSTAQATARWTSSSREVGAPKSAITESPMNLSMVPPWRITTSLMRSR